MLRLRALLWLLMRDAADQSDGMSPMLLLAHRAIPVCCLSFVAAFCCLPDLSSWLQHLTLAELPGLLLRLLLMVLLTGLASGLMLSAAQLLLKERTLLQHCEARLWRGLAGRMSPLIARQLRSAPPSFRSPGPRRGMRRFCLLMVGGVLPLSLLHVACVPAPLSRLQLLAALVVAFPVLVMGVLLPLVRILRAAGAIRAELRSVLDAIRQ